MNVVSVCPLRVASLDWLTSRGVPVLTVIAKATYHLTPVTCPLAEEQEYPNEYESHWNYDPERSLHSPSDLVPYKPRPEVTLVGQAFAPRGEPVARLVARLIVGSVDKSIVVHAERSFAQDGGLRLGPRFNRMPLRYERAAGGPDTKNPVGVAGKPDTLGTVTLPNLEPPGLNVTRPDDFIEPVGFGPVAADWPARRTRLGRHAGSWSASALRSGPIPEGIDPLYFLSAPPDQVLDELRANERLVLEHLHPEYPRLVTSLPGYEPRAFVEPPHGPAADLPMVCDTLWIDTDRAMCTLTWRGQLTLDAAGQEGRVVVAMEMIGRTLDWSDVEELAKGSNGGTASLEETQPRPPGGSRHQRHAAIHDARAATPSWPVWLASGDGEPEPLPGDVRIADLASGGTGTVDDAAAVPRQVIEAAVARAEATRSRPALPSPPVAPLPRKQPFTMGAPAPKPPATMGAPAPKPPFTMGAPAPKPPFTMGAPAPKPPATMGAPKPAGRPGPVVEPFTLGPAPKNSTQPLAKGDGSRLPARPVTPWAVPAAGASVARPADRAREPAREHVDLLWFDPAALPRIFADEVLGEGRPETGPTWVQDRAVPREPREAQDRRELLAVMSRGRPVDEQAGIDQVAVAAYDDDGTFTAPLVLVAGELSFDFDEVETLRAVLTAVAPFLGADPKLREITGNAAEALEAKGRLPGDIAAGFTRRIEEAFAQGERSVAPGYLDTSVERILLEDRRYPRKALFGEPRLRALLAFPGESAPVPTYLSEALAARLPLYRRFKARAIVELHPQQDQYETHADALLVLALGRVLRRG